MMNFFATAPKYLSELLAEELRALGAEVIATKLAGVIFKGDLRVAYRACLWSRLANRILLPLRQFEATTPEALYQGVQAIDWSMHLTPQQTIAVNFSSHHSKITHTQFGAQKTKDAIVDQCRANTGERPTVQLHAPDVMINVYVDHDIATVSIDFAGESLHKRGYRAASGEAPLKENLAAAILMRAGWLQIAAKGGGLVDLMCGVGTLPIEAAFIAGNIAPGLLRTYFGFLGWRGHQSSLWEDIRKEALLQQKKILSPIVGFDANAHVIQQSIENSKCANLLNVIHFEKRELAKFTLTAHLRKHPGLVIANPPYGERLGDTESLRYLYQHIGTAFKTHFIDWHGALFTGNPELGKTMGVRAKKYYAFYNGKISCRLLLFHLQPNNFIQHKATENKPETLLVSPDDPITMFINRLEKNIKHLTRWAKRENIHCYRLYDADLPEYAIAIDRYGEWIHIQEYAPPKSIDPEKAKRRMEKIMQVLPSVLNVPEKALFYKTRHKQSRIKQYEKLADAQKLFTIQEGPAKLLVNLSDYIDTGLFLDQRLVRQKITGLSKNKRFLNLFGYTGSASIFAAIGGASHTTTVDLSATYLQWAKKNMALNGFSEQYHHFIQADCLQWLTTHRQTYGLIFVAPPVFSQSKRMSHSFDIQRDHRLLLIALKKNLSQDGMLVFATHKKNFKLDSTLQDYFTIDDWSHLLPSDFQRDKNAFYCWSLQHRSMST